VRECAVVGAEDDAGLVKPSAFVALASGREPSEALAAELIEHCRANGAAYKRPRWVTFVGDLPRTATGKIQRFRLRR
jgi:acyl-coenzyme A synthetase/AMP-(fatty) acid ligase